MYIFLARGFKIRRLRKRCSQTIDEDTSDEESVATVESSKSLVHKVKGKNGDVKIVINV